jgi:dihydrofolate reductase
MTQSVREGSGSIGQYLFGRVTYEIMARFWPTPAGQAANPVFAGALNSAPKIVFSKTLPAVGWQNTEIARELSEDSIRQIKQQPGNDIMIFGSGSIVNQLARLGCIDEYQLMLNPLVLGQGKTLFDNSQQMSLQLVSSQPFRNGVVQLTYRPAA